MNRKERTKFKMSDYNTGYNSKPLAERDMFFETPSLCYIYKKFNGIQVKLSRVFSNPTKPYETDGWNVMLDAANILSTEDPNSRNPRLDWGNSIKIKLSLQEVSRLAKYSDLQYIKALGSPIPMMNEESGDVMKDASGRVMYATNDMGKPVVVGEFIYHKAQQQGADDSSFSLVKSKKDYNGAQVFIKKGANKVNLRLTMDELILFGRACKFAFDFLCQAAVDEKESLYFAWKKAKQGNGTGNGGGTPEKNSYAGSNSFEAAVYGEAPRSGNNGYNTAQKATARVMSDENGPRPLSYRDYPGASREDTSSNISSGPSFPESMYGASDDDIPF